MHSLCASVPFTNRRPRSAIALIRASLIPPLSFTWFMWMLDSLSGCETHRGCTGINKKTQLLSTELCVLLCWQCFCAPHKKSYKVFLLHTLLTNCIKAFGDCCLSPRVCTSIKKRAIQHVEPVPDTIKPAWRDTRMHKPGERDRGICLSPLHTTNTWQEVYEFSILHPFVHNVINLVEKFT